MLAGSAVDQYRAAANRSPSGNVGGIVHLLEAVKHLLQTYETEKAITEALEVFNEIHQTENENEVAYAARLNNAAYRCGNVHDEDDKICLYVKGLLSALKTILQRFRNRTERTELSIERIVQLAVEKGGSYRHMLPSSSPDKQNAAYTIRTIKDCTVVRKRVQQSGQQGPVLLSVQLTKRISWFPSWSQPRMFQLQPTSL